MPESEELLALDAARAEVEHAFRVYQEAIRRRNAAARQAKEAGHPAWKVNQRAGWTAPHAGR